MSAPIARAARLSRAYSSAAAAAAAQQPQSVACFGPLYTKQVKRLVVNLFPLFSHYQHASHNSLLTLALPPAPALPTRPTCPCPRLPAAPSVDLPSPARFLRRPSPLVPSAPAPSSPPALRLASSLSPFTTTSDALARQTLRTPLPSAAFSAIYTQTLTGPLHKRVVAAGPTVTEPLPAGADTGTCKVSPGMAPDV